MLRTVKFIFIFVLLSAFVKPSYSQVGVTSVPFLNIEPDARSSGLGFTGLTQTAGANSSFWNPSLLAFQETGIISLSHFNWLSNISSGIYYDHVSISSNLTSESGIAVDFTYFNLGEQLARDENGNDLGSFGNNELALRLAYGHRFGNNWSFGVAMQYFRSSLASGLNVDGDRINAAGGLAVDLGGFYQKEINIMQIGNESFRFGYNLSSFGLGTRYYDDQGRQALPTKLRAGWSYELELDHAFNHRFIFTNEFSKRLSRSEEVIINGESSYRSMNPFSALFNSWSALDVNLGSESARLNTLQQVGLAVGAEYWFNNLLAVRTGYFHEHRFNGDRQLVTLGTGLRIDRFGVDFSYMNSLRKRHPLDNTMKLTVLVNMNLPKRKYEQEQIQVIPDEVAEQRELVIEPPFEKQIPVWSPMDTVYVQLYEGFVGVQFPESDSPAEFIYTVEDETIAYDYTDKVLALRSVGMTRIYLMQAETEEFTEHTNSYVLVVLPDPVFEFASVNFDFDKDIIREEDKAKLDHVADIMSRYPHVSISLNGHTDNFGPREYNIDLSRRRSEAVKAYLVERGISADRIAIQWFAFDVPAVENTTRDNRFINRRVEVIQVQFD
jgi:outer membrane protein OmpA-like peptidoglycan-associated protein